MNKSHFSWLKPIAYFFLTLLAVLSLSRLLLVIWQFDRVVSTDGLSVVFLQGLRFDLVVLGLFLFLPCTLLPLFALSKTLLKPALTVVKYYLVGLTGLFVFLEVATPNFILQFDFRPNILFVEYLNSPKEVFTMLIKAVPGQLVLAVAITLASVLFMYRLLSRAMPDVRQTVPASAPILAVMSMLVCVLAARSALDHRPVNPSTVAFSSDPLVNSLPLNSTYTVAYAIYEKVSYESANDFPYGNMPYASIVSEIQKTMNLPSQAFYDEQVPTLHNNASNYYVPPSKRKNLVIILEESLGADYVGKLGGLDITPHLDALADTGIWFTNLYATGTRSVRGIEAVITGFLPTPMRSVVKLGGSQNNFFSIAELLSRQNYATSFVYGGEAHFDNMKRFFSNNGFDRIIDEKDYENPEFYGSWGASDEDLFNKAHEVFTEHNKNGEPFFSLVFSSSNHSPFDFPDNKIELYEQPKATVANAVKYADYALGKYIEKARQSAYWEDTVFLIIADHSDKVFGSELVPIERFRIPALILNADKRPRVVERISSQIDMLPTLLSVIGVKASIPAVGVDLTRDDVSEIPGRAIMQYGSNQAYMEGDEVVVLQKHSEPKHFNYVKNRLVPRTDKNLALETKALAHGQWPLLAYRDKNYRLPDTSAAPVFTVQEPPM